MGLWGYPAENTGKFRIFYVEGHPGMKCHIEEEVFQWMEDAGPMPEGGYLFMVEGVGRLRFCIV